jgi:hypothetical protein
LSQDSRLQWLPLRLLVQDRFDPGHALTDLRAPKLFLDTRNQKSSDSLPLYYAKAAPPKTAVMLSAPAYRDPSYAAALGRFLSAHLPPAAE